MVAMVLMETAEPIWGSVLCSFWQSGFCQISRQYGTKGYRVESTADFIPTLKTALAQDVPSVIDCPVDYRDYRFTQRRETLVVAGRFW